MMAFKFLTEMAVRRARCQWHVRFSSISDSVGLRGPGSLVGENPAGGLRRTILLVPLPEGLVRQVGVPGLQVQVD